MAKSKDGQNKKKIKISTVLIFFFCSIVAFTMLVPFVWMVSASFKLNSEIFSYPVKWIPEVFRTLNYEKVWQSIPFLQYFLNTLKLAVIITLLQLFTCSLAAFAFTKLHFPGRDKIFVAYLATMMVPWHAIMIPQFIVVKAFGMYNTHLSLIVLQAFSAFGVFLLRQNMLSIPDSLHEAAKIDGAGILRILKDVYLPLSKPILAVISVYTIVGTWNSWFSALVYLPRTDWQPLQLFLRRILVESTRQVTEILTPELAAEMMRKQMSGAQLKYAMIIFTTLPILFTYPSFQKYFVKGVMLGSLKE